MLASPIFGRVVRIDRFLLSLIEVNVELISLVSDGCSECADDQDVISHFSDL